ncbi:hypothetical protein [Halotalea alkalilenta]|uniref:hypothetical protein n=1 Tax=Halotalea alkalilenta TaxID=376489 RepID=UPI0006948880|nr:hypothetical protein [Halotalea alkalilenta]
MDARKIEWDIPFKDSVTGYNEPRRMSRKQPKTGCIITARYHGANVRLRVLDRDGDKNSIAEVIGVDADGAENDAQLLLNKGDTVVVPDSKRAVVRYC